MNGNIVALPSRALSQDDAASLEWYFGPGQTVFERSTFGAMLERAALQAYTSQKCRDCDGAGIIERVDKPRRCSPCGGAKCQWCDRQGNIVAGCWCRACGGTGRKEFRQRYTEETQVTARPTPRAEVRESAHAPDDWALTRYAVVSRRIGQLSRRDAEVLAAYHGDAGTRWGATRHGRIFAVLSLTPAGKRVLRAALARSADYLEMAPAERIGVEAEAERVQPRGSRGALLLEAREQAAAAYERAVIAWNSLGLRRAA